MKRFVLAYSIVLSSIIATGQTFIEKYYPTSIFHGSLVARTNNVATGYLMYGVQVMKTDLQGNVEWAFRYYENSQIVRIYDAVQTADGGFVLLSQLNSITYNSNMDVAIIKLDAAGTVQWFRSFGHPNEHLRPFGIMQSSTGDLIMTGHTNGKGPFLTKYNSTGNFIWIKVYDGNNSGFSSEDIIEDSDGSYVMTGIGSFLFNTDTAGSIIYSKAFTNHYTSHILQTSDQGYLMTGTTAGCGIEEDSKMALVKVDSSANLQWATYYYGPGWGDELATSSIEINGGYLVGGESAGYYLNNQFDNMKAFVMKVDYSGNVNWAQVYDNIKPGFICNSLTHVELTNNDTVFVRASGTNNGAYFFTMDTTGLSPCSDRLVTPVTEPITTQVATNLFSVNTHILQEYTRNIVFQTVNLTPVLECDTTVVVEVAQEEESFNIFTIHPNPSTGVFTVSGAEGPVQVFDLLGNLVLAAPTREVDLSEYPSGIYIVRVGERTSKLVLSK